MWPKMPQEDGRERDQKTRRGGNRWAPFPKRVRSPRREVVTSGRVPSAALFKQTMAPQHVRTPFSALLNRGQGKGEKMSCRQEEPKDVIRGLCGCSDTLHLNASSVQMDNQGNPSFVPTLSKFETSSTATRRPPQNTLESLSSGSFNLHRWPAFVLPVGQPPPPGASSHDFAS